MNFNLSIDFGRKKKEFTPTIPAVTSNNIITTSQSTNLLYNSISNALARYFNDPRTAVIFSYHNIPAFTAPVNFLIQAIVDIPFVHEKKVGNDWKVVENSWVLDLFRKPNEFQTETEYFTLLLLNLILTGEVFINKFTPIGFSKFTKLYVLPSTEMIIDWNNSTSQDYRTKSIQKFRYNLSEILPDAMIWRKEIVSLANPTERGVSRLYPLVNSGRALQAIAESTIKTIEDRGALGIISPTTAESVLSPGDPDKLQKKISEKYGITGDKSTVIVTQQPVSYTPISFNVQELQLNETSLRLFRDVCMILNTPSQMLGDSANTTYNNLKEMKSDFYSVGVIPRANWMLEMFEQGLGLPSNEHLRLDTSKIESLKADRKVQSDIANQGYNSGLLTGDEGREMIGLDADGRGYKVIIESKITPNGKAQ